MLAVSYYRNTLGQFREHGKIKEIIDRIDNSDYVVAPIADNKMFELMDAFMRGEITDLQCLRAMAITHLGVQFVFKKQVTLDKIGIVDRLYLCEPEKDFYSIRNKVESNTSLNKAIISKRKFKNQGRYISELLMEDN